MYPEPNPETICPEDFSKIMYLLSVCLKSIDRTEPVPKERVPEQYFCINCATLDLSKPGNCVICGTEILKNQRKPARLNFEILFFPEHFPRAKLAETLIQSIISTCLEGLGLQSCILSFSLDPRPQPVNTESEEKK